MILGNSLLYLKGDYIYSILQRCYSHYGRGSDSAGGGGVGHIGDWAATGGDGGGGDGGRAAAVACSRFWDFRLRLSYILPTNNKTKN